MLIVAVLTIAVTDNVLGFTNSIDVHNVDTHCLTLPFRSKLVFVHEELHSHRKHPWLRFGEPCPDRLGLFLDLAGDLLQSSPQGIDVSLELLVLGWGKSGKLVLAVERIAPSPLDCLLQLVEDGRAVGGLLAGTIPSIFFSPSARSLAQASRAR